jgi:hypothetical protein
MQCPWDDQWSPPLSANPWCRVAQQIGRNVCSQRHSFYMANCFRMAHYFCMVHLPRNLPRKSIRDRTVSERVFSNECSVLSLIRVLIRKPSPALIQIKRSRQARVRAQKPQYRHRTALIRSLRRLAHLPRTMCTRLASTFHSITAVDTQPISASSMLISPLCLLSASLDARRVGARMNGWH